MPYFLVVNNTHHHLRYMEDDESADLWHNLGPHEVFSLTLFFSLCLSLPLPSLPLGMCVCGQTCRVRASLFGLRQLNRENSHQARFGEQCSEGKRLKFREEETEMMCVFLVDVADTVVLASDGQYENVRQVRRQPALLSTLLHPPAAHYHSPHGQGGELEQDCCLMFDELIPTRVQPRERSSCWIPS